MYALCLLVVKVMHSLCCQMWGEWEDRVERWGTLTLQDQINFLVMVQ